MNRGFSGVDRDERANSVEECKGLNTPTTHLTPLKLHVQNWLSEQVFRFSKPASRDGLLLAEGCGRNSDQKAAESPPQLLVNPRQAAGIGTTNSGTLPRQEAGCNERKQRQKLERGSRASERRPTEICKCQEERNRTTDRFPAIQNRTSV